MAETDGKAKVAQKLSRSALQSLAIIAYKQPHACEHHNSELMSRLTSELGVAMDSVAATHVEAAVTAEDVGSRLI